MRITSPVNSLFPPVRQEILAATYGQPERWWFLSELASFVGKTPSSLQRELKALSASGILRTKRDGNRLYFQAETNSPIFEPLRELVEQTLGVKDGLKEAIQPLINKINLAFIYGSVPRNEDKVLSDVDLIVVGRIGLSDLSKVLRPLETRFGREFNATCYSSEEFEKKILGGNHFLNSILKKEKTFLIGDANGLDRLAGK